ncbi:MAG: alcohol dehydrogenase catalytic domain-containing protein, partial [Candidatus Omnitrophica bacterium]|nr:alcohol dehydrogenase catalytic domain-containing protein [Candidatus Omnitrophota bacterium]
MRTVIISADWVPRPDFKLCRKDIDKKLTYLGSKVWKSPKVEITEKEKPKISDSEVLIEVRACGICGSDVHMA